MKFPECTGCSFDWLLIASFCVLRLKETGLSNNDINIYWGETRFFQRNTLYFHSCQEISKCYSFAIIGAPVLRGWSTYSSGEAYGWCNCRQVLDMSILVKLHEMSILLHKFGCCACHVARQVVDVLTRQKANSLTVICFPIAIDVRKYHITEEYE